MKNMVYKIKWLDDEHTENNSVGIITRSTYSDAIDALFNYYGEQQIVSLAFDFLEDDYPIEIDEQFIENYLR